MSDDGMGCVEGKNRNSGTMMQQCWNVTNNGTKNIINFHIANKIEQYLISIP
jgi:hypothetical protein